jgi:hypothetical protein
MKWVTREKIKVDRVACPWLIKKFIDRDAEFVFLSHDTDWAKVDDGIVFDVPNCELGHRRFVQFNLKKVQAHRSSAGFARRNRLRSRLAPTRSTPSRRRSTLDCRRLRRNRTQ